jgi:hypothetical protein
VLAVVEVALNGRQLQPGQVVVLQGGKKEKKRKEG